jgi:DNA polymerase II small subunit/DNA polymerase delta subunit B
MRSSAPTTRAHHRPVLRARNDVVILPIDYSSTSTATAHIRSTTPTTADHQQVYLRHVGRHGEIVVSDICEDHAKHI